MIYIRYITVSNESKAYQQDLDDCRGKEMYADFGNQLYNWAHYTAGILCLFILIPRMMFELPGDRFLERSFGYVLRIVFWFIVLAYALIMLKLFEMLALLTVLLIVSLRKSVLSLHPEVRGKSFFAIAKFFYDWTDGIVSLRAIVARRVNKWRSSIRGFRIGSFAIIVEYGTLFIVLAVSAFMRFYDTLRHPAPAMSDAYVAYAWMKFADERMLFAEGIYPQGYYYILDYLHKFAAIDPLYVLRFTGPVTNLLIVVFLYYFVQRLSGSRLAGIIAAAGRGIFGYLPGGDWDRQAASLSQEFGFFIMLPTLYFFYLWLQKNRTADYRSALFGASAVGLVHAIAYAFLWLGAAALMAADLVVNHQGFLKRLLKVIAVGFISAVISTVPIGLGLMLHKHFHASSLNYTFEVAKVLLPPIRPIDIAALVSAALLLVSSLRGPKPRRIAECFIGVFGFSVFFLYEYAGWLTQKAVLMERSPDLWALTVPLLIGMAAAPLFRFLSGLRVPPGAVSLVAASVILGAMLVYPPQPIYPYKLESDEGIDQYLRISQSFTPKSWLIVYSFREANNMTRGKGFHMYVGPKIGELDAPVSFLGRYDPTKPALTRYGEKKPDTGIGSDVFIFYEKEVFKNNILAQIDSKVGKMKEYRTREEDMKKLREWLDAYERVNGPLDVYYDGQGLTVYHIRNW